MNILASDIITCHYVKHGMNCALTSSFSVVLTTFLIATAAIFSMMNFWK